MIGMRIGLPRGVENFRGLARLARFGQPPAGKYRGRHQIGRQLDRIERQRARGVAVHCLKRQRARREQHGALAAIIDSL